MNSKILFCAIYLIILINYDLFADENKTIPPIPVHSSPAILTLESGERFLTLNYKNFPKWHTYWKNPGDAGLPIQNKFFRNGQEIKINSIEWPIPKRYIEPGNIWAYGYEGSYSLFYPLSSIENGLITIKSNWLVCKHICIPGSLTIEGEISGTNFDIKKSSNDDLSNLKISSDTLMSRFKKLPKQNSWPKNLDLVLAKSTKGNNKLNLFYNLSKVLKNQLINRINILSPFPLIPFTFKHEKLFYDKKMNIYGKMEIDWDGEYQEPAIPFPKNGKFKSPYLLKFLYANPLNGKVEIIQKTFSSFSIKESSKLEDFLSLLTPFNLEKKSHQKEPSSKQKATTSSNKGEKNIFLYLFFAFIGGLILNIMPCVLPIISLKLFSLIKNKNSNKKEILLHNLFYSLGILFSFFSLALVIIILKSTGQNIGWGFQLQSPYFVAIMVIIIFIFALNLFGLFEFQTPGGTFLGNIKTKGHLGDFFNGILATILSTPCSAPFLGTALAFAFTSNSSTIFLIFFFIGLGLSFPFLLTGIFPQTLVILPKPGVWMENIKKILGLTLLLTTAWLFDIFNSLTNHPMAFLHLSSALAFSFFILYMKNNMTSKWKYILPISAIPIILMISLFSNDLSGEKKDSLDHKISKKLGLTWEPWSPARLKKHKNSKNLVFVDFTADWCLTCKANEKLILDTEDFRRLVKNNQMKLLLADWTRADPIITAWLKSHGLAGVPAYFIQRPDGKLINLGEVLTINKIKNNIR